MNPLITDNLDAIRALAQEYGVARLEAFGSVCTNEFDEARSDIDFIVEYPPDHDLGPWMERQFELQERLQAVLGRDVELFTSTLLQNKWVRAEATKTRQTLYQAPGYMSSAMDQAADEVAVLSPGSSLHPKSPKWLDDIQDASAFILEQVAGMTLADYKTDRRLRAVVERKLVVIGVALAGLRRVDPRTAAELPEGQEFIDIGEHVIRDYDAVDQSRVWTLIAHTISILHDESELLLRTSICTA